MRGAVTAAVIVAEFLGTFALAYLWEERVLRWYLARARKSRRRMALVISGAHTAMAVTGLLLVGFASAISPQVAAVVALLLALPYGAVAACTLPAQPPVTTGTADTARKLGARKLAGTIGFVGGAWSFVAVGLWFAAVFGGLTGLGLVA